MASLKCLIKCIGLPVRATFKLLHAIAYVVLHCMLYEGLRFQFVHFKHVYKERYNGSSVYYVHPGYYIDTHRPLAHPGHHGVRVLPVVRLHGPRVCY